MSGTKSLQWRDLWIEFSGEVDQQGNASGYGVATRVDLPGWKYEGTFFNNKLHGYGTLILNPC